MLDDISTIKERKKKMFSLLHFLNRFKKLKKSLNDTNSKKNSHSAQQKKIAKIYNREKKITIIIKEIEDMGPRQHLCCHMVHNWFTCHVAKIQIAAAE